MLKNKIYQEKLERDGYVVINFFSEPEIQALIKESEQLHSFELGEQMFFSNRQLDNPDYQNQARQLIRKHFSAKVEQFFDKAAWMEAVFVIKPPKVGVFANHQDWSLVDEDKYRSIGIWCPLLDVDASNGTFCILSGSHKFFKIFRSPTIPPAYHSDELNAIIDKYKKVLSVKKGDVIVFDHAAMHSTTPNLMDKPRPSIFIGIRPAESPILHYFYHKDSGKIEGFEVDGDFFYNYDYVSRPDNYKSIGFVEQEYPLVPAEELIKKILTHRLERRNIFTNLRYRWGGVKA
ncbi:MAG: phytanoyl-CoA dioxygenase family protein [Saprospiraceae bacterium]|nr:phytanoyl-CoA dioxygenase family protein [Saprospiraceae bacterium]